MIVSYFQHNKMWIRRIHNKIKQEVAVCYITDMSTSMHNKYEMLGQWNYTKGLNLIENNRSFATNHIDKVTIDAIKLPTSIYIMIVGCLSSLEYLKKACYTMLGPSEK
jgi:hypothetical protein